MDKQDNYLKQQTLSSKLAKLSPAKQALLEKLRRGKSPGRSRNIQAPIERVARNQELPLSFLLEYVLEEIRTNPTANMGSIMRCFRLAGAFDEAAMEMTVNELARRHEALRTRFQLVDGRFVQIIAPSLTLKLRLVDLHDIPEPKRLEKALSILAEEAGRPYHPGRDPLWRVVVARLDDDDHLLLLSMSHLISDDWSMELLVKDSLTLYQAFSTGRPSPFTELPIQFADYAYWQRQTLRGQRLKDLTSYWKRQLAGHKLIPELRLPIDKPLPAEPGERHVRTQYLRVPAAVSEPVKDACKREGVSLFMLLLAVLVTILHRYTGRDDFGIPSLVANRSRPETTGVIGWFADYIVLRVRLSGAETFVELLQNVRNVVLEAYEHLDLPFSEFEGNGPQMWREAAKYPTVRFCMAAEGPEDHATRAGKAAHVPGLAVTSVKLPQPEFESMSPPGLAVFAQEKGRRLEVRIVYELERHDTAAIDELLQNYLIILEDIVVRPDKRLMEFPLVMNIGQQ